MEQRCSCLAYPWMYPGVSALKIACADPHCFWPTQLPPGVLGELREWLVEISELKKLSDRIRELRAIKAQLKDSEANGGTHLRCCTS